MEREKLRKKKMPAAASAAATDYSKSLSGTAADTKAEKDFEKMMREGAGDAAAAAPDEDCDPLLVPVTGLHALTRAPRRREEDDALSLSLSLSLSLDSASRVSLL